MSWKEILNESPTMFAQDKSSCYFEEDKYLGNRS